MKKDNRGFTGLEIAAGILLLGGITYLVKPSIFPGSSKRAKESTETTAVLLGSMNAQSASAAASVSMIAKANSMNEESPIKTFISHEALLALSKMSKPDPKELLEAEKRKNAVLEGKYEEANRLYQQANQKAAKLEKEVTVAIAAKQKSDLALEQAAAAEHASFKQKLVFGGLALLFLVGWIYSKVMGISPATLGLMAADIRAGVQPLHAMDTHLAPRFHAKVKRFSKLATEPKDE